MYILKEDDVACFTSFKSLGHDYISVHAFFLIFHCVIFFIIQFQMMTVNYEVFKQCENQIHLS